LRHFMQNPVYPVYPVKKIPCSPAQRVENLLNHE